jgi:hypothetical protein
VECDVRFTRPLNWTRAYAANRDKKKSLQSLNAAVEKGFSDAEAITANKAFDFLRNEPEYQKIITKLRKG